ncbi:MAG: hypothetical protein MR679_03105 [Bacteroidales bacterium]|nr:hypothetical protein [Bacteroidales bacterium]
MYSKLIVFPFFLNIGQFGMETFAVVKVLLFTFAKDWLRLGNSSKLVALALHNLCIRYWLRLGNSSKLIALALHNLCIRLAAAWQFKQANCARLAQSLQKIGCGSANVL